MGVTDLQSPAPAPGPPGPRLLAGEREGRLLAGLQARDERALVELVDLVTPWLLAVAEAMLTDRDEAEEVVQETFTIAWRRIDLFDASSGRLVPWLLRITRNRAIDRIRSKQRRSKLNDDFESQNKVEQPEFVEDTSDLLIAKEADSVVHNAVMELTPEQRQAIQLAYFNGLTQSEIADKLNEPLGTVKARIRRGVQRLEQVVKRRL